MRKTVTHWMCLLVLSLGEVGHGMATEQIGPDSMIGHPTVSQPGWPKGIVDIPRHPSRTYSIWVNGNENFYFQATPADVNDLVALFAKARMRDHEVVIAAERKPVKTFKGEVIDYNVSLQIVAGIVLFMAREGKTTNLNLPLEPRLTIFAGDNRAILNQVTWPKNLIVRSEIPGVSVPSGRTKPQRDVYYGKLEFADGSPPVNFVQGVNSRITLWEQQAADGIDVGSVNNKGYFRVFLSEEDVTNLKTGKIWLTITIANFLTEARKTDQRFPPEMLTKDKDQARPVQVTAPAYYFGRLLFEDGSPAILDPAQWPGAEISVDFPFAGMAHIDLEGYFRVLLTTEQFEKLSVDKPRRNVYVPDPQQKGTSRATTVYPANLLSRDRAKAGVVKIPRPDAPKKDTSVNESAADK